VKPAALTLVPWFKNQKHNSFKLLLNIRVKSKVTVFSPSLWACFHPPVPSFSGTYLHSNDILLNEMLKNAKASRVTIVAVQVTAVKIYVAAMEALRKNERQDETHFTTKSGGKTSLGPSYFTL
jgi:hypothetical protein